MNKYNNKYIHMHISVRQYSLCNPVPWIHGGGVLSLLRVLAQLKTQVSLLGVSATIESRFGLGLRGHRFGGGGGGHIAFGTFA